MSVKKVIKKAVMYNYYYYDFFSWAQFSLNCSRTIVRQILKLSVKFKNCPANLENCPPNFQNCPPNFKIVRQILKFYFFFQNCPPKKKLSAYSPDNGQFRKLSADNCPPISQDPDYFWVEKTFILIDGWIVGRVFWKYFTF